MNHDLTPVQGVPVLRDSPLAEIAKKLEERIAAHDLDLREHRIRLDNGVGSFSQLREEISRGDRDCIERMTLSFGEVKNVVGELKVDVANLRPKPTNWLPIIALCVTVLIALFGGVSWLQDKFSRGATKEEVKEAISELRQEIKLLRVRP